MERTETEIYFFQDGGKIKTEKKIYHHRPSPVPTLLQGLLKMKLSPGKLQIWE
jgi:hypothetical protein